MLRTQAMQLMRSHHIRWLSLFIVMGGLLLILPLHLLACFIAGFVVYELVNGLTPHFQKIISGERARWLVVALISTIVVSVLTLAVVGITNFLMQDVKNPAAFNAMVSRLLTDAQSRISPVMLHYLPANIEELQREFLQWLREHVAMIQMVGKNAAHAFVTMLIGMILGAIVSLQRHDKYAQHAPLKSDLLQRVRLLGNAFRNVVFAQFQISLIILCCQACSCLAFCPCLGSTCRWRRRWWSSRLS